MKVTPSNQFSQKTKKLFKKRPELRNKVYQKLTIFETTPSHPTLKLHKLKGDRKECWGISIEYNLRIVFVYVVGGVLLVDIGPHDEVYR